MNTLTAVRTSAARHPWGHPLRLGIACLLWASASWQAHAAGPTGALAAPAPITSASYPAHPTQPPGVGTHVDITGWLTPAKRNSLGLSLGLHASDNALLPSTGTDLVIPTWQPNLGVHWRTRLNNNSHLDFSAWTGVAQGVTPRDAMELIREDEPERFGARVELQWKSSRTGGLVPEFGAIGLQLDNRSRLLLRARHGGPMIYYRARF